MTWKEAQDIDNDRGEVIFSSRAGEGEDRKYYVRAKSDVRTLYEMRPPRMKNMVLGQLAKAFWEVQDLQPICVPHLIH